jgi:hypothetical protein
VRYLRNAVLLLLLVRGRWGCCRTCGIFCATLSTYIQEDVGFWLIDEEEWAWAIAEREG